MSWEIWGILGLASLALVIAAVDSYTGLFLNAIPYMRQFKFSWPITMRVARDLNNTSFLVWIVVNIVANLPEKAVLGWFTTVIVFYIIIRLLAWKTHPQGIKGL